MLCGRRESAILETSTLVENAEPRAESATFALDLVNERCVTSVCGQIQERIAQDGNELAGIIHCAARGDPIPSLLLSHARELERCLAVNVTGPLLMTQKLLGEMRSGSPADLVFVGAGIDEKVQPGTGPYGISKMALKRLFSQIVEDMVHDHHPNNPRVMLFKPGVVDTPGLRAHVDRSRAFGLPHAEFLSEVLHSKRASSPVAVAELLVGLLAEGGEGLHGREITFAELAETRVPA